MSFFFPLSAHHFHETDVMYVHCARSFLGRRGTILQGKTRRDNLDLWFLAGALHSQKVSDRTACKIVELVSVE